MAKFSGLDSLHVRKSVQVAGSGNFIIKGGYVQEDGALQRSGLIAAGFRAHVVFQIFVEVFAGIVIVG